MAIEAAVHVGMRDCERPSAAPPTLLKGHNASVDGGLRGDRQDFDVLP